ncbi:MAG: DUF933 domain-containing protein, partial [Actinobacteria bacterium]|nr:DUF933 domain-containing protein [Actinomycetota bacterium]
SLEAGERVATPAYSAAELSDVRGFGLFAMKPAAVALNCAEPAIRPAQAWLAAHSAGPMAVVSASLEAELMGLDSADAAAFRADAGLPDAALARVSGAVLGAADRIRFYTGNERQITAWLLPRGATALDAAGTIHSDLARGFVRVDVAPVDDVIANGGLAPLRASGRLRQEGRDSVIVDGDFLLVHFTR